MIKNTFAVTPEYVSSAYSDNAAVMQGWEAGRFYASANEQGHSYDYHHEPIDILMNVES
jgi:phosphoribosylformylglycinamidine synthase